MMEIDTKDLAKRIKELKEENLSLDGQIRFSQGEIQRIVDSNPEIQSFRKLNAQHAADYNTNNGTIKAFEELLALDKSKKDSKEIEGPPGKVGPLPPKKKSKKKK